MTSKRYTYPRIRRKPGKEKYLFILQRISLEANEEYLNLKAANAPIIEDKSQHCDPTNVSKQGPSTHVVSECLHVFLLGAKIISENSTNVDNDINLPQLVFSYILKAIINALTPREKKQFISCLKRISLEGNDEYLNFKGANTPSTEGLHEDKSQHCDSTNDSIQRPSTHDVSVSLHLFMMGAIIFSKNTNNTSIVNDIISAVFSYVWEAIIIALAPEVKEQIISCLKSLDSKEGYLNRKGAHTSKTEGCLEEKQQDITDGSCQKPTINPAFASSTSKKANSSFKDISEHFAPSRMLQDSFPEGLLLAQSIYCAKTALAFYNSKHGTEYKLVEPLASARILSCKMLFHCNFTASKLKMDGSRTARPKLFFASFVSLKKKIRRMICHIIDPAKAFYMCCEECPPELAHIDHSELALIDRFAYSCSVVRNYGGRTDNLEPRKNRFHAEMALDIFNKKHGTMYKLVKSLKCNIVQISFGVYKFHCNFKAKVEDPAGSCAGASSSKLFFGSIVKSILFSEGEGDCCILDATEGLHNHCSICREGILHPADYRSSATRGSM